MRTVYKYPMQLVSGEQVVRLPMFSNVLACQAQGEDIQLWAEVQDEADMVSRNFIIAGTGHPLPNDANLNFIDTFQLMGGTLVFHVFEVYK